MDSATARANLPFATRQAYGEFVTIIPWVEGEMKGVEDTARIRMMDKPARFDKSPTNPDIGGGHGEVMGYSRTPMAGETITFSLPVSALDAAPRVGDRIVRVNSETYRILREGNIGETIKLYYCGKVI